VSRWTPRDKVDEIVGASGIAPAGSPPFTPRAKKVLELSYRESLQLAHNYIGTEHLLLGLLSEGHGVAAQVLVSLGAGLEETRKKVFVLWDFQPMRLGLDQLRCALGVRSPHLQGWERTRPLGSGDGVG